MIRRGGHKSSPARISSDTALPNGRYVKKTGVWMVFLIGHWGLYGTWRVVIGVLRFEINLDAARESGLEVSSKLLRLAKRVVDQGKGAGAKKT
jgi:hypothetical protein